MGTLVMAASAVVLVGARNHLGALFSSEASVVTLTSYAVPPLAASLIGEDRSSAPRRRLCLCL
jgi:MATE family multidrug resistance protein